jgi:hypothetical protein
MSLAWQYVALHCHALNKVFTVGVGRLFSAAQAWAPTGEGSFVNALILNSAHLQFVAFHEKREERAGRQS